jgi:uncharacterized protein
VADSGGGPRRSQRAVNLREALRGSRVIPFTPWTASGRWSPRPMTWLPLLLGLWLFGTGEAFLVAADLGNTPWIVLSQGLSLRTELSIGGATFVVSLAVLALWIPLKEKPGLGTVANIVVIAVAIDVVGAVLSTPSAMSARVGLVFTGIALVGMGSSLYLTAGLGPGPRDGWMTSLHRRLGMPVGRVRLAIEVSVLTVGYLLGGTVGLGTLLFALLIGRAIALALALVAKVAPSPTAL